MSYLHTILQSIKKGIYRFRGKFYLQENMKNIEEKKLLHISDTPDCIYPFLLEVIDKLNPEVIIHTGDVADNLKSGAGLSEVRYQKRVGYFINKLEQKQGKDIYLVPGNHDLVNVLKNLTHHINIKPEGSTIIEEDIKIGVAHYMKNLPARTRVNLYGHDKQVVEEKDRLFLNGILHIHLVLLPSLKTFFIPYPLETEGARKYRRLKLP